MGTISQVHTYPNGLTIGFDSEANDWVPVDKQAFEGSTLGNIARGANRSGEMIVQGIKELAVRDPTDQAAIQAQTEALARRQQAASAAAPVAETVGGAMPDVAAGVGLGLATSGLGLPAVLGAEAGLGAVLGGIRPGTVEERIQSAVISSGLTVLGLGVGAALGPVAVKGIGGAVTAFRGLEGRMLGKINQAVETSGAQLRQADEAAAAAAGGQGRSVGAAETPSGAQLRQADEAAAAAAGGQGRSVGAAETPAGEIDAGVQLENRALQAGDEAGADLMDQPRMEQMAVRARELDMPTPIGFGSRAMSPARILQQANEYQPFGDTVNKSIMNRQAAKMSEYLADALGVAKKPALFVDDLADAEASIGAKFEAVQRSMPNIEGEQIAKALESIGNSKAGVFGSFKGQKMVASAIDNARGRPILDGEEFMNTRATLSAEMADAYARSDVATGDMLMAALNKIDQVAEKTLKRAGDEKTAKLWETARGQWRVLKMTQQPGAVNVGTGEVNPLSLFNRMSKAPSKGGWGRGRPDAGTPARKLYDALEIGVASQSGVPKTGALAPLIQGIMRGPAGQAVAGGAAGYGLWDALRN